MTKAISASTLARQAAKTKNPALAKRYRTQAAKLRREARSAKAPDPVLEARATASEAINEVLHGESPLVSKPWYESDAVQERLRRLAKKSDATGFDTLLRDALSAARTEARDVAQKEGMEAVSQNSKAWQISIVSAFLAKCETMERLNKGMPRTAIVDGLTLARIVDALRDAGYTADGRTGRPQWRAVGS